MPWHTFIANEKKLSIFDPKFFFIVLLQNIMLWVSNKYKCNGLEWVSYYIQSLVIPI